MKLPLILLLLATHSNAMDPFSMLAVVSSAGQAVGTVSEVVGTADAFTELYSEISTDAAISEDGQKLISQIEEIESLATDAGYTSEEIDQLGHQDKSELLKLQNRVRAVTRAVRVGKKSFRLFRKLEQKAQSAAIESASLEREQLSLAYRSARFQQEANLADKKRDLLNQIDKRHRIISLREELKKKGAKLFGTTGVLSFPKSERVIETSIEAASKLRNPLIGLMLLIFCVRLIFYQFGFFGVTMMGDLVRDTVLCSLLLMIYPEIVRAIISYTIELSSHIGATRLVEIRPKALDLPTLINVTTGFKLTVLHLLEWLKYGAFAIIEFFMTFGLSIMVMVFPLVIFASQMMNFAVAWPLFLGCFISIALWPLFWNLVGLAADLSWGQNPHTFSETLYSGFFTLLQIISPVLGIKLLSGQPLSKAIGESVRAFSTPASMAASSALDARDKYSQGSKGMTSANPTFSILGSNSLPSPSKMVGSAHGYLSNQLHHRIGSAKEALKPTSSDPHSNYLKPKESPKSALKAFLLNTSDDPKENTLKHAIVGLKARPIKNTTEQEGVVR